MSIYDADELAENARQERIEKLRKKVESLGGSSTFISDDCPSEIEENFLKHVIAYEEAAEVPLFDTLLSSGISLPRPEELGEEQLTAKLWELINALSLLRVYLDSTNHLSDRELYTKLWCDVLREPTVLIPDQPSFSYHLDMVGSGSEEDIALYLKYYADEDYRQDWAKDWPDDPVPPHETPPFDRDRHLPQSDMDEPLLMN
ncbi:MAG TPA: hypothetical protein VGL91_01275 [Acidobacteriota bacterium]|jgi:hypothetical protein